MQDNKLELLTIYDLIKETDTTYNFYIPSYQRGYRWTERQVEDLLNDLQEFIEKPNKVSSEFYCLQPIVIKPKQNTWEVIDGQQRLTTIYLILKYFNNRLALEYQKALYKLTYETRENSSIYLDNIEEKESLKYIDYYHIFKAYDTIKKWFLNKQNLINDFESALLNSTKIIWYEVHEDTDSIDIFTRLNIGKIPLTNAELIKALLLLRDNFKGNDQLQYLRQLELAGEWDRIEYALRDKEFWGFLSNGIAEYDSRIEFIFDLMSGKQTQDKDFTFRYFHNRFSEIKDVEMAWQEVKFYFLTFQEWYNDRDLFHLVGYLITVGEKIEYLKTESKGKTKTQFKQFLKVQIRKYTNCKVAELNYLENSDKIQIRRILLLFNIISIISNKESNYRFQFGRYKTENWDIEHIHSVKSGMPERDEHQKDWLNDVLQFTNTESLKIRIKNWLKSDKNSKPETFDELYDFIVKQYSEQGISEEINDITNLTLLDAGTNRGYKNALFPIKRKKIIHKDQNVTFIPLCTKNVFLKYYSESVDQMSFWGRSDRNAYLNSIVNILDEYLPQQKSTA
jgi:uncharacterized protein with ParB-like and HNH nuclease domain